MNTERLTFFFYGTLMDAAICARVTGMAVTAARLRPATLDDYKIVRVADQHYPTLVPSPGERVQGRLLRNVGPEAQRRFYRPARLGEMRRAVSLKEPPVCRRTPRRARSSARSASSRPR